MNAPSKVILDQESCRKCTAVDEEYDGYSEIGDDDSFGMLLWLGHLNLRRDEDKKAEDNEEPLVFDEPFEDAPCLLRPCLLLAQARNMPYCFLAG